MERHIYLDNAATTPLDSEILQSMLPYFSQYYGNADSPHAIGRKAIAAVDNARDQIAKRLGAKPSEIYFTSGGTEANNWAILGAARAQKKLGKTRVLISAIEHHSALFAAEMLRSEGFEINYIPVNEGGRVELTTVQNLLRHDVALVCVMRVNNETGVKQPIDELTQFAHSVGALMFTDCVQAVPHEEMDIKKWGADLISISSHKLHGPKGCGALYVKSGVRIERLVGGGEQERGMRGGTLNVPAIVGFAAALQKTAKLRAQTEEQMKNLQMLFLREISVLDGITVNGGKEERIAAVLSLRVAGVDNATLLYRADLNGLCIAAGSACASASVKPSHVLVAMGMDERAAKETVRVSFGRQNTEEEVVSAAKIFIETVKSLRKN